MQHILESHKLERHNLFEYANLIIIELPFNFSGSASTCKKSVNSIYLFLRFNKF